MENFRGKYKLLGQILGSVKKDKNLTTQNQRSWLIE